MSLKNIRFDRSGNSIGIYVIVLIVVILLVGVSYFYKFSSQDIYNSFPLKKSYTEKSGPIFYLYIFFSKHNCNICLDLIPVLNDFPPEVKVIGVIPDKQLEEESQIRQMVGAAFELEGNSKYKKYIPIYSPALIGVSETGKIFFVLPVIPEFKDCLFNYVMALKNKIIE